MTNLKENDENANANFNEEEFSKRFNCAKCHVKLTDVKLLKSHYWKVHITKNDIIDINNPAQVLKEVDENKMQAVQESNGKSPALKTKSETKKQQPPNKKRKLSIKLNLSRALAKKLLNNGASSTKSNSDGDDEESSSCNDDKSTASQQDDTELNSELESFSQNGDGDDDVDDEDSNQSQVSTDIDEIQDKLESLTEDEIKYYNMSGDIDEARIAERVDALYDNMEYNKSKLDFLLFLIFFFRN